MDCERAVTVRLVATLRAVAVTSGTADSGGIANGARDGAKNLLARGMARAQRALAPEQRRSSKLAEEAKLEWLFGHRTSSS